MILPPSGAGTGRRGFLLLRRDGGLWGVASGAVETLGRRRATPAGGRAAFRIGLAHAALAADEIVGVVDDLQVRPMTPVVRRFWSEPSAGWAVHGELPVVLVDPGRPPSVLRLHDGEDEEGAEGDPADVEVLG